ncbi:hypothetical protein FSC37_22460 [Piscinibacter aquaticus]|uniref:Molecular chaperone n=1 Tax=Piscinibacter aquaticus TaxID=392597 RepID=A0A5C6TPJ3_9BURK|nr:hypothetical protein FSC37_22460 [Piscinibacter aquaticus]
MKHMILGALLALSSMQSMALGVDKLLIDLDANGKFSASEKLTVYNDTGNDKIFVTAQVFQWSMDEDGAMKLTPTTDVKAFPTVQTIDPGATGNFRVRYVGAAPKGEAYYRVLLKEVRLPASVKNPDAVTEAEASLQVGISVTVPIYVSDYTNAKSALERVQLEIANVSGEKILRVDNQGAEACDY